jgi:hypothetical protein
LPFWKTTTHSPAPDCGTTEQCLVDHQYVRTQRIARNNIPSARPEDQICHGNRMILGYFVNIRPFSYLIVSQEELP